MQFGLRARWVMEYICEVPGKTWFRIETEAEAAIESRDMDHAVERHFKKSFAGAVASYVPPQSVRYIEQSIGRNEHVKKVMPMFLTLRGSSGEALATAMIPPGGKEDGSFSPIIVGPGNKDPYPEHEEAIAALADHFDINLDRSRCYPYRHR